jgi:hypothetical protein
MDQEALIEESFTANVIIQIGQILKEQQEARRTSWNEHQGRSLFYEMCPGKFEGEHIATRYYWSQIGEAKAAGESYTMGFYRAWQVHELERLLLGFDDDAAWFVAVENNYGFVSGEAMSDNAFTDIWAKVEADDLLYGDHGDDFYE